MYRFLGDKEQEDKDSLQGGASKEQEVKKEEEKVDDAKSAKSKDPEEGEETKPVAEPA